MYICTSPTHRASYDIWAVNWNFISMPTRWRRERFAFSIIIITASASAVSFNDVFLSPGRYENKPKSKYVQVKNKAAIINWPKNLPT